MSWHLMKFDEVDATLATLAEHDMVEGKTFKIHTPGYASIVTGKRHGHMGIKLLLFFDDNDHIMAKLIL